MASAPLNSPILYTAALRGYCLDCLVLRYKCWILRFADYGESRGAMLDSHSSGIMRLICNGCSRDLVITGRKACRLRLPKLLKMIAISVLSSSSRYHRVGSCPPDTALAATTRSTNTHPAATTVSAGMSFSMGTNAQAARDATTVVPTGRKPASV